MKKKKNLLVPLARVYGNFVGTGRFPHFWSASKFPVAKEIYLRRKLTGGAKPVIRRTGALALDLLTCWLLATI